MDDTDHHLTGGGVAVKVVVALFGVVTAAGLMYAGVDSFGKDLGAGGGM